MRNPPRLNAPTIPGEAPVLISLPIARLLDATCGIDAFLRSVRTGSLDGARSRSRFNTTSDGMQMLRSTPSERHLPDGMPGMKGEITGRRATGMFSLDVSQASLGHDMLWHEMLPRGMGDAQLTIRNVELPPSVLADLPGRPLRDLVDHPLLGGDDIVVRTVTCHPAYTGRATAFGATASPASLEMRLDVPRVPHPDHDPHARR